MADFKYDIKKNIFSIPSDTDGWTLELNLVSWNGRDPKYDLRKWQEDHEKMGKGCSMSEDEVVILFQKAPEILKAITGEDINKEDVSSESSGLPFN